MLVFVLNQAQKANTGKIQTPVYENVREFGMRQALPRRCPPMRGHFCYSQRRFVTHTTL